MTCAIVCGTHADHATCVRVHPTGHTCVCDTCHIDHTTLKPADFRCESCGRTFPHPVRYHSGSRECGSCWGWRKLDGPMARYWIDTLKAFADDAEEPLNIDLYDSETWTRMGIDVDIYNAIITLKVFRDRMEIAANTKPGTPEHRAALGYSDQA